MAKAQTGICAPDNLHGLVLLYRCVDDEEVVIRQILAKIDRYIQLMNSEYAEAVLSGVVAIGSLYWEQLYPENTPILLTALTQFDNPHEIICPDTPFDLLIQLRSDRKDINLELGMVIHELLIGYTELVEEYCTFRYLDGRDLMGFIDGISNAQGLQRRKTALIVEDEIFAQGSYVHLQKFRHHRQRWQQLATDKQEQVLGCKKSLYEPIEFMQQETNSHLHKVQRLTKDGQPIEIIRHGMPYASMLTQGQIFTSFCHTPKHFDGLFQSMLGNKGEPADHLFDYTVLELFANFFAPSSTFLQEQGK